MSRKVLVIIGDGMSDEPVGSLGGKTPLEVAETPNMDSLAAEGFVGLTSNVPPGMEPGSDVAIMSILGYDPAKYYTGRGPLEALSMGVTPRPGETAFRCNLITVDGDTLVDYSAGHITTEESGELVAALDEKLGGPGTRFHHGVSFRNLLLLEGDFSGTRTHAPHDHMDEPWKKYLPSGPGSGAIVEIINKSMEILFSHPLNAGRRERGARPANACWPWSGGPIPELEPYSSKYGLEGTVVSAVDLVQGLGAAAGLDAAQVPGATGLVDTNYEGKVRAAAAALETRDYALIHIEGIDEAGHMGDPELKIEGIRRFDRLVVGPLAEEIRRYDDFLLLLLPDHPTPLRIRTHSSDPVPFVALKPGCKSNGAARDFTEKTAKSTGAEVKKGYTLLDELLNGSLY